jgi:hypothetical protein
MNTGKEELEEEDPFRTNYTARVNSSCQRRSTTELLVFLGLSCWSVVGCTAEDRKPCCLLQLSRIAKRSVPTGALACFWDGTIRGCGNYSKA